MANTLTNLIPTLYEALDTVSRELVGFIPAVRRDTGIERAAKDQTVRFPIVPAGTVEDITPGQTPASSGSQTIGNDSLDLSSARAYPIVWNGEEERSLTGGEGKYNEILRDQFSQGFRALVNEMETDIAELYVSASRAYGTSGTTPFGTADDLSDIAETKRILKDNGAPMNDLNMVFDTAAGANLGGTQSSLFKVNEAGTPDLLRNGRFGRVNNLALFESGQIQTHSSGTTGTVETDGTHSIGDTNITVTVTSIDLSPGDVVTISNYDYVVAEAITSAGDMVIAEPGLMEDVGDDTAVTVAANDFAANMAFDRNALVLAVRPPAVPSGGDAADDSMLMTDPVTGITFEVSVYRQYKQVKFEVGAVWGVKAVKPEHMALLLG